MNYTAVTFTCSDQNFEWEILIAYLSELGYDTFEELDLGLKAYIHDAEFSELKLEVLLNEKLSEFNIKYVSEDIPDKNWNEVWESNYDSVVIANRCLIRAPFHPSDETMEFEILIEPQMSFGTAHHETTAMMIEYALGAELINKKILDMGSGTGVLAILASMRGANEIDAIDIDEWAYKNCLSNTKKNKTKNIQVIQGDAEVIKEKYDIIFANINLNILLKDMEVYAKALNQKAEIYFSGFYQTDLEKLEAVANQCNLQLSNTKVKNNWMAARFSYLK